MSSTTPADDDARVPVTDADLIERLRRTEEMLRAAVGDEVVENQS